LQYTIFIEMMQVGASHKSGSALGSLDHSTMHRRTMARWTFGTFALSLPGLWLCNLAGVEFSRSLYGGALEILFTIGACIGLLSLAVIILAWKKPTRGQIAERVASGEIDPSKMSATEQVTFYASYGSLPRWLCLPFLAVGVLLTVLAALGIVDIVIWMIVS
jgi:hypothetical protein